MAIIFDTAELAWTSYQARKPSRRMARCVAVAAAGCKRNDHCVMSENTSLAQNYINVCEHFYI